MKNAFISVFLLAYFRSRANGETGRKRCLMAEKNHVLQHAVHEIAPVFDENSRVLILGSFPSVKSREGHFFYNHPRNRFWKVIAAVCQVPVPQTIEEKRDMLLKQHIAVWDVIHSCDIYGSSDSSIRNVVPNDLGRILDTAPIRCIFTNGKKSEELYKKYCEKATGRKSICLPSTSPANAAWSEERLTEYWKQVDSWRKDER